MDLSTPPVLDLESLLRPISEDQPSGRSLAYEGEYDQIKEARRADEDLPQGAWTRDTKTADWDLVIEIATDCLGRKTKDLQIAAWLTEASARLYGLAGLRDGFLTLHGIQQAFWDSYYPQVEDNDLESRAGPFFFLNDARVLPRLIRSIPLVAGDDRYSLDHYHESRETENQIRKNPDAEDDIIASGRLRAERFDQQVAATSRRFYERLVADLRGAFSAFDAFDRGTDERFGRDAPSLGEVRKALDEYRRLVEPILTQKRRSEPDPELDAADLDSPATESPGAEIDAPAVDSRSRGTLGPADGTEIGRMLIEFQQRAEDLASAGVRLRENRDRYAELLEQLAELDREYATISNQVGRDHELHALMQRLLRSVATD